MPGIRALKHHNSDIFPLIPAVVLQKWWIPDGIRRVPREKDGEHGEGNFCRDRRQFHHASYFRGRIRWL